MHTYLYFVLFIPCTYFIFELVILISTVAHLISFYILISFVYFIEGHRVISVHHCHVLPL